MSDDKPGSAPDDPADHTQPVRPAGDTGLPPAPAPAAAPAATEPPVAGPIAEQPVARRGFRERFRRVRTSDSDRAFSLGALIASGLAGVIVGGLGMAAIHAVGDDHRDGPGWDRRGPMMGRDFGGDRDRDRGGPMFGGPGGPPGQVQPPAPPDDDDFSPSESPGDQSGS